MERETPTVRPRPRVTVRDVAKLAGVHPATVSRVLNEEEGHRVSPPTVERIQAAAKQLRYTPNSIGRGLRTKRSFTAGVLIPDLTNPVYPPMIRGIEDFLDPLGYTALLTNTDAEPEREIRGLDALAARQVDGFIIAASDAALPVVKEMTEAGVPVVLVYRTFEGVNGFAVTPDDRRGAESAMQHLASLGHRAIAHVGGPQTLTPGQQRYLGYRDAMRDRGERRPERLAAFADAFRAGAGVTPVTELLQRADPFTAIFAANDLLALDCINTLRAAGLECPRDVSVVGFNDMPFADSLTPALTTVRFNHYEIGRQAGEMLVAQINGDRSTPSTLVLPTELIVRASTAKPPARAKAKKTARPAA